MSATARSTNFQCRSGALQSSRSASISDFANSSRSRTKPETNASTVNGWLTEKFGRIPDEGDVFSYENLTLKVTKSDGIMANEVAVRVNDTAEKSAELQR